METDQLAAEYRKEIEEARRKAWSRDLWALAFVGLGTAISVMLMFIMVAA